MEYAIQKPHCHANSTELSLQLIFAKIKKFYAVYTQRKVLLQLTSEQLEDIGISREDAEKEASKFFWE